MRRVLIVAYVFPPLGGGGVQRTLSFVRHLPSLGWRPTVICADPSVPYWARDESLLDVVPPEAEVVRVSDGGLQRLLHAPRRLLPGGLRTAWPRLLELPDRQVAWFPAGLRAARRALRETRFDAVYTTSAPFTDHLVALGLGTSRPPWIADFRDPWTDNRTFRPVTEAHRSLAERWEAQVVAGADLVVANTPPNAEALRARYPGAAIDAIPNGWEPADFAGLPGASAGKFTIAYAGSFYAGYGPDAFLRYLDGAFRIRPELRSQVELRFAGKTDIGAVLRAHGLDDIATERGYLSQRESLAHLAKSQAQLLVLPPGAGGWVPQKLYVGLRIGRPFVAVCPDGEARRILTEAGGTSLLLRPDEPQGAERLADWLTARIATDDASGGFDAEVVARYDRTRLAARLAAHLDRLAG